MKNVPKTRFSSFTESWDSKLFSETFSVLPNNTLSRAELSEESGTVKNIHYGDVLVKYREYLDAAMVDIPYIASEEQAEKWKNAALQSGDVIMADTAEDETAGKCTEIGNVRDDLIVSGLHTIPLHPQVEFSAGYLGYFMNSDSYHNQLLSLMQGTKVTSIPKSHLAETLICYPAKLEEQGKIAEFLYGLDKMILSQQQKCEKLVGLKAACLDKMFPKSGQSIPLIRFSDYRREWAACSLGDLLQFLKRYSVVYGDALFQRSSETFEDAGRSNVYLDPENVVVFGGFVIRGRQKKKCDPKFMKYLLDTNPVRIQIITHAQGAQHINVSQETLHDVQVYLPEDDNEQRQIGEFFYNIDALLTSYQKETKKLQQFKQAMLHDTFV